MPRSLPAGVVTEKNRVRGARPFLTVVFNFDAIRGGPLYLCERGPAMTIGGNFHYPIVKDFGEFGSTFSRGADGELDITSVSLKLLNFPGSLPAWRFSNYFFSEFESVIVGLYVNFLEDDLTTISRFRRYSGVTSSPTDFDFEFANIEINALRGRWLERNVLRIISPLTHPSAADASWGKAIALALGDTTTGEAAGARIPAIHVGEIRKAIGSLSYRQPRYIACENPAEIPVSGIGSVYYDGHKIIEQDFAIESGDDSEDVPLHVQAGDSAQGMIPDIFETGFLFLSNPIPLGRLKDGAGISHIVQPFRVLGRAQITSASLTATRWNGASIGLRPLALGILNDEDASQWSGSNEGGILASPTTLSGDINMYRVRGTSNDVTAAASDTDPTSEILDGSVLVDLHGRELEAGRQHYAVTYIEGASVGIPADPVNQWYNIGTQPSAPSSDLVEHTSPAYAVDFDGNVTPLNKYLNLWFNMVRIDRVSGVVTGAVGDPATSDIGATGNFAIALEPEDSVVLLGATLGVKKSTPMGAPAGTASSLKGSTTLSIVELDSHGGEIQTVATAQWTAEELNGVVGGSSYSDEFRRFSTGALLLRGKRYTVRIDGHIDSTGQYSGWVLQMTTRAVGFTGSGAWGPANTPSGYHGPTIPWPTYQPITTNFAEPVHMNIRLHCLRFNRISAMDEAGVPVWLLEGYMAVAGVNSDDIDELIPDGITIASDANATKTSPEDVAHALLNRATVPDARIDLAGTFAASATFYASRGVYKVQGAVVEQVTCGELLARIAFENRTRFDWEDDKAQWKVIPDPGATPTRTLALVDLSRKAKNVPDVTVSNVERDDRINVINLGYRKNYSSDNEFFGLGTFLNESSIETNGDLEKKDLFKMRFIRLTELAAEVGFFYIVLSSPSRRVIKFTTFLQTLELQKDDVIGLDLNDSAIAISTLEALGGSALGAGPLGMTAASAPKFLSIASCLITSVVNVWASRKIRYEALEL